MPTTFEWVRERLINAGTQGVVCADLLKDVRGVADVRRRNGTYPSFFRTFWVLVQLKYIEETGQIDYSFQRGVLRSGVLSPRVYYRLSDIGRDAPLINWTNPYKTLYPQLRQRGAEFWQRYYQPTGRPRGRPRIERVRRRRAVVAEEPIVVEIPTFEAIPEAVPEPRRRVRISRSQLLRQQLNALQPALDTLRDDASGLTDFEAALLRVFDEALDALETARGEERERVDVIARQLEQSGAGFSLMRAGLARNNREQYLSGLEILRRCCE